MVKAHLKLVKSEQAHVSAWLEGIRSRHAPVEAELLQRAYEHVAPLYAGRELASGEPLLLHALETAGILAGLRLDHETLAAALLYPCLEAAPGAARELHDKFGSAIADLAEGAARMAQIGTLSSRRPAAAKPEQQAAQLEALRKMLLAMVQDVRVVLIKIADHVQELRYLAKSGDPGPRREAAELTRDIFAPLANRLGIWQLKWELEDLALRILEPETYQRIARLLDEKRTDRERYIEGVIALLKSELAGTGIAAEVTGRPKHIFSIYKKMKSKAIGFNELYDVRAVRILVKDIKDCYAALGLVHNLWSPIPKEFDDYIARPKSNKYRSLHTAVTGPESKAVEVQIRTHEMHQHSELGVAAHWRYKEEGARHDKSYDEKIAWLRQILDWKDEVADANELVEQFKTGLFDDTVYVLTPQGQVIDLPRGATPIDFAYHVHTELGHRCRGARVDGAMVPLNTPLHNGQQVEIIAAKQGGPSRDWLNPQLGYLRSQGARTKVRQWFNRQNYEADVAQGRTVLDKELQRHGMTGINLDKLAADLGHPKLNDFLAALGRGEIGPKLMQEALRGESLPLAPAAAPLAVRKPRVANKGSVLVVGVDKLLTVPAKCCKPAPPEPIIGFVTRGRGITVHRADCASVRRLDPERRVTAEWGNAEGATFPVDIEVEAVDRTGLLRDISEVLSRERINVTATNTASRDLSARMRFTLEITNLERLQRALQLIREVRGVMRAVRR